MVDLNSTTNQCNLSDIYRMNVVTAEYIFLSSLHGTFAKLRILSDKTHFSKIQQTEIVQSIFSDHKGIKVKIGNRMIIGKSLNIWRLDNTLVNNT